MGAITIGIDENGRPFVKSQFEKELNANKEESQIAEHFLLLLEENSLSSSATLERRADNYLSLCSNGIDFLRFKYTPRAKWLSIDSFAAELYKNDPRFAAQKKKNQRFWKANITDLDDLDSFDGIVIKAVQNVNKYEK